MENYANLADLIYEPLKSTCKTHTFGYGMYGDFKVIIRNDGYINATKLCTAGGKDYYDWSRLKGSKAYIEYLSRDLLGTGKVGAPVDEIPSVGSNPNDKIVSGTYVHPELITTIAQWISVEFATRVSRIVNNYLVKQHKDQIKKLEYEAAIKDGTIAKQADKIDELMAKLDEQHKEHMIEISRSRIELGEVLANNAELLENTEDLKKRADKLLDHADKVSTKLGIATEQRVPPAAKKSTNETLAVFALAAPVGSFTHYISCGQEATIKLGIKRFGQPIFQISSQPNSKNLYQRIKETPGVITHSANYVFPLAGIEPFLQIIKDINDDKYVVDLPKKDLYKGLSREDLKNVCRVRKIKGFSTLTRTDLIALIETNGGL